MSNQTPSWEQVAAELKRERKMRLQFFAKMVSQGKLSQEVMDHRIKCIDQAIQLVDREIDKQIQLF